MTLIRLAGGLLAAMLLSLTLGTGSSPTTAGIVGFTVNTSLDDPDNTALGDGVCDTGEGVCSLRAAVQELNAFGGTHTITVPAGTYSLSFGAAGEDAAATGDLDLTADGLTIQGAGVASTIIQKSGGPSTHRVFDVISGDHTISDVTIQNGLGDGGDGGGIRILTGSLTLINDKISGNVAGATGGGIFNSGTLTVIDSTISGNDGSAGTLGGGISNDFSGTASVIRSTISGNTVGLGLGGGIRNRGGLTVHNSTISGNTGSDGSGISNIDPGVLNVTSSTIFGNTGSGILVSGTTFLTNTIIGGHPADCTGGVGMNSMGYNIEGTNTCGLNGLGDLVNTDPELGALASNGGPTQTHAPLPGSPAVDAGSPANPGSGGTSCPVKDQRHLNRPADGNGDLTVRCDMGALEACPAAPDGDGDFVGDACDNCPATFNAGQEDYDGDNAGNAFEAPGGGNVDCNSAVNSVDALKVLRSNAGLSVSQEEPCQNIGLDLAWGGLMGDVDCSGAVSSVDALKILRTTAALTVAQAPGCPAIQLLKP